MQRLIHIVLSVFVCMIVVSCGARMSSNSFLKERQLILNNYDPTNIKIRDNEMILLQESSLILRYQDNNIAGLIYSGFIWINSGRLYLVYRDIGDTDKASYYLHRCKKHAELMQIEKKQQKINKIYSDAEVIEAIVKLNKYCIENGTVN